MDNSLSYKCPACGANITYNTQTQDFYCEYCGSRFASAEELDAPLEGESVPDIEAQQDDFGEKNRLYLCPSCGAAVITDSELSASAECYYCHSPVVLSGRLSGEFRPDLIIPFKKTREQAVEGFNEWTGKKKKYLAKGFGSPESLAKMQAIYIPFWLTDCRVDGRIKADCFKTLSSIRKGDNIVYQEQKSVVIREGSVDYAGVPADGSSRADDALMDSIEPFNYSELINFDMSYLAGHSAIRYDISGEQVMYRVQDRTFEDAEKLFTDSIKGYSRVNVNEKEFSLNNVKRKNVMLPVWFMTYFYKDKMYYYAMNGQTGKFGGTLPIDKLKLFLRSTVIPLIAVLILAFLISLGEVL